jgi:ribulose-phosphate 3-epimerase
MSVNPGFGGQAYIPEITDKIARLRRMLDGRGLGHIHLQVDGGVKADNVAAIAHAGATNIVAGSAIFNQRQSVAAAIQSFREQFA